VPRAHRPTRRVGIDLKAVTEKLQKDGLEAFVKSFDTLVESIEAKRDALLSGINERTVEASLGKYADAVSAAIREAEKGDVMRRVWRKDAALWKTTKRAPEGHQERARLAQRRRPDDRRRGRANRTSPTASATRAVQARRLCGMGGSSLAPEVLRRTFGKQEGFPGTARARLDRPGHRRRPSRPKIDVEHTLFVVSSKSGTTTEP
jgi:transaldolase/glucose-6-phosphate isomerase